MSREEELNNYISTSTSNFNQNELISQLNDNQIESDYLFTNNDLETVQSLNNNSCNLEASSAIETNESDFDNDNSRNLYASSEMETNESNFDNDNDINFQVANRSDFVLE